MSTSAHRELAAGRWRTLTLAEQLANVGSEVDRAIRAWETGRHERFERALARGLELFDPTACDDRWTGPNRREVLRLREEFCRLFFDPEVPPNSADGLRHAFYYYGVLARRSRD